MGLKSFFFKEEPEVQKKNVQKDEQPQIEVPSSVTTQAMMNQNPPTTPTEINENGLRYLWQVLSDKNLPGPDLLEVKSFADSLKATGDSLEKRYLNAFLMLKMQSPNFSKESLLKSIDTYEGFIKEEQNKGEEQFIQKRQEKIGGREAELVKIEDDSKNIRNQIAELEQKLVEKADFAEKLRKEIADVQKELEEDNNKFRATISHFLNSLNSDRQIITNLNI